MSLQEEIDKKKKNIFTDSYSMSVGELLSLYRDDEIDLHPEFQRFFRWTDRQKTWLIESLLVGIPIPPIFVYQRDNGVWDVIDGVQRLSAVFQFAGILVNESGERMLPLKLTKGDYLPSLEGKMWKNEDMDEEDRDGDRESEQYFSMSQRIALKRAKFDINIIRENKEDDARYQLFKRINMGGTPLSEQEIRNFLTVMINKEFFDFLQNLVPITDKLTEKERAIIDNFKICTDLPDHLFDKKYDMELLMCFFALRYADSKEILKYDKFSDFLTQKMMELAKSLPFDFEKEKDIFEKTFQCLSGSLGKDAFRKYDHSQEAFSGAFSPAAFDVIAIGIASNIEDWFDNTPEIHQKKLDALKSEIKSLWKNKEFQAAEQSEDTIGKVIQLVELGKKWFQNQKRKSE